MAGELHCRIAGIHSRHLLSDTTNADEVQIPANTKYLHNHTKNIYHTEVNTNMKTHIKTYKTENA